MPVTTVESLSYAAMALLQAVSCLHGACFAGLL